MKALHRILDDNIKNDVLQILIEWIFEHLFKDVKINTDDVSTEIVTEILNNKINSVKDLWRSCKSAANILLVREENINKQNSFKVIIKSTYENFKYAVQKAIENNIKNRFDYEAEWIVKNEILNIPIKSKLMIMLDDNKLIIDKVQKLGIDKIYNIEYVNFQDWMRKQKTWSRFTKIY